MRRKLAATVASTIAAAVLIAPVLAGHVERSGSASSTARSGSAIIASKF
jgi:hypothetical protein